VWIHVQVLVWLRGHTVTWSRRPGVKLGFIVFTLLLTHTIEIMMFAGVFFSSFNRGWLEGPRIEAMQSVALGVASRTV